jgi:hypothetical protein
MSLPVPQHVDLSVIQVIVGMEFLVVERRMDNVGLQVVSIFLQHQPTMVMIVLVTILLIIIILRLLTDGRGHVQEKMEENQLNVKRTST